MHLSSFSDIYFILYWYLIFVIYYLPFLLFQIVVNVLLASAAGTALRTSMTVSLMLVLMAPCVLMVWALTPACVPLVSLAASVRLRQYWIYCCLVSRAVCQLAGSISVRIMQCAISPQAHLIICVNVLQVLLFVGQIFVVVLRKCSKAVVSKLWSMGGL